MGLFKPLSTLLPQRDSAVLAADVTAKRTTSAPITASPFSNFPDLMMFPSNGNRRLGDSLKDLGADIARAMPTLKK